MPRVLTMPCRPYLCRECTFTHSTCHSFNHSSFNPFIHSTFHSFIFNFKDLLIQLRARTVHISTIIIIVRKTASSLLHSPSPLPSKFTSYYANLYRCMFNSGWYWSICSFVQLSYGKPSSRKICSAIGPHQSLHRMG